MSEHSMKRYPGVYREKGRKIYMITWSVNGRRFRESSHSEDPKEAYTLRCKRLSDASEGAVHSPKIEKVKMEELFDDLERNYEKKGYDVETLNHRLKPLRDFFDYRRAVAVGSVECEKYGQKREKEKTYKGTPVTGGTINREYSVLRRAFNLGVRNEKVRRVPHIEFYQESNPRQGFYEYTELLLLSQHLPEELKNLPLIYFLCGWRKREILTQEWCRVDFNNFIMWLPPSSTKEKRPRIYPFKHGSRMHQLLLEQREYTDRVQRERGMIIPYVFHRAGKLIKNWYGAWNKAHKLAKIPRRIPHMLRNSTTRIISLAQAPRVFAKQITGHSSDKVFDAYAGGEIESLRETTGMIEDQMDKMYHDQKPEEKNEEKK